MRSLLTATKDTAGSGRPLSGVLQNVGQSIRAHTYNPRQHSSADAAPTGTSRRAATGCSRSGASGARVMREHDLREAIRALNDQASGRGFTRDEKARWNQLNEELEPHK